MFDRACESARESLATEGAMLSAFGGDADDASEFGDDQPFAPAEVLRVLREPIDWLLTVAHRLACGDPHDEAAVDRVRAAFFTTLAGRVIKVRTSDILVVCGILVGALDPEIVMRAVTDSVSDGISAALDSEGSRTLAFHLATVADVFAPVHARPPFVVRRRRHSRSRSNL